MQVWQFCLICYTLPPEAAITSSLDVSNDLAFKQVAVLQRMKAGLSTVFGGELYMPERVQQWKAGLPCALAPDLLVFTNGCCYEKEGGGCILSYRISYHESS